VARAPLRGPAVLIGAPVRVLCADMKTPRILGLLLAALVFVAPSGAEEGTRAAVPRAELTELAASAQRELRGNILPFWLANARDREHGGFHSFIGEDMKVDDTEAHGLVLTSRILWTFSAAYRAYRDPQYLEMARWAYRDLTERFVDKVNGGLFWAVTPDGKPEGEHKPIYGEVFGIYGLAEYYRATGDISALQLAISVYNLVDKGGRDPVHGGYFDTVDQRWRHDDANRGDLPFVEVPEHPHPRPRGLRQPAASLARRGPAPARERALRPHAGPHHQPGHPPPHPLP